ncbi:hypothetical protein Fuma_02184 [Fuerstiella marisgermanici]|uniref:Uncharacterized protein n=1 Tax=Fuerstiella marisgermanici TaxID=1891926 RepID=A0A1P8WEU1_9PLAN|nr:hypothetical protein Fuma_02184 [Fuerstiella marisgermanici]
MRFGCWRTRATEVSTNSSRKDIECAVYVQALHAAAAEFSFGAKPVDQQVVVASGAQGTKLRSFWTELWQLIPAVFSHFTRNREATPTCIGSRSRVDAILTHDSGLTETENRVSGLTASSSSTRERLAESITACRCSGTEVDHCEVALRLRQTRGWKGSGCLRRSKVLYCREHCASVTTVIGHRDMADSMVV